MENPYRNYNPLAKLYEYLKTHELGITISVGAYLLLVSIGMVFSFFYYITFKINIFRFSNLNDFIMAPFQEIAAILFVAASLLILGGLYKLNEILYDKFPVIRKWTFYKNKSEAHRNKIRDRMGFAMIGLYVFVAVQYYALYQANQVRHDTRKFSYQVLYEDFPADSTHYQYLGDNSTYFFLYNPNIKQAVVVPLGKVKTVSIHKNPNGSFF
ncbi:hypothetical protein GCM10027275_40250 [Rhabdobacter roseus]|uniref:Uncharacterized protein n=1 Tax=Rhabdobacter roseus TaxID=1655419 RepID=A0A840TWU3_9BACT|nr:hypothetical protein [Rhabdobacter roseus]MBB5285733.1 hypothetical protein [Rhabdobacter roseus]